MVGERVRGGVKWCGGGDFNPSLLVTTTKSLGLWDHGRQILPLDVAITGGSVNFTVGRIRTPRSIRAGLDEHPPFDILGGVVVGQYGSYLRIMHVLH